MLCTSPIFEGVNYSPLHPQLTFNNTVLKAIASRLTVYAINVPDLLLHQNLRYLSNKLFIEPSHNFHNLGNATHQ